jgi:hypothetical protein
VNPLGRLQRRALVAAVVGLSVLAVGAVLDPTRAFTNLLIGALFVLGLAAGALVWLCLLAVSNAGWAVVVKRVLEGFAGFVPAGAILLLATLPGMRALYLWARPEGLAEPAIAAKRAFLNPAFFTIRMALILAVWALFAAKLRRWSLRQDREGGLAATAASKRLGAGFLATFAVTACLGAFDWVMTLEPAWYSTIFGLYNLAGILVSSVSGVAIAAVLLSRAGFLPQLKPDHLHDLGKLMFGFATFWAYLWISQFLLIWYANLPDETAYFELRWQGGWMPIFFANLIINWGLPFLLLLPRAGKRNAGYLLWVALLMLAGRWLDLWLMTMPGNHPTCPAPGIYELCGLVGPVALFVFLTARTFQKVPLLARNDPYLGESLHHHI